MPHGHIGLFLQLDLGNDFFQLVGAGLADLTNREIKLRLYQRAADLGWSPRRQGWGMLDMGKLLR